MKTVIFWGVFGIFSLLFQGAKTAAGENDTSQKQTGQTNENPENAGAPASDNTSKNPNGQVKTFHEVADEIYRRKIVAIEKNGAVMKWGIFGVLGGSLVVTLCDYPSAIWAALGLGVSIAGIGCYCAFKNIKEKGDPPYGWDPYRWKR